MGASPRVSFQLSCGHEVESSTETSQGGYSLRVIPQYTYCILLMFTSLVPRPSPSSCHLKYDQGTSGGKLGEDLRINEARFSPKLSRKPEIVCWKFSWFGSNLDYILWNELAQIKFLSWDLIAYPLQGGAALHLLRYGGSDSVKERGSRSGIAFREHLIALVCLSW